MTTPHRHPGIGPASESPTPEQPGRPDRSWDLPLILRAHVLDGPLELDPAHPAMRAIIALIAAIKDIERDGDWPGTEVVTTLTDWLTSIGADPESSLLDLARRPGTTSASAGQQHVLTTDINIDRVVELLTAMGFECTLDTVGGGHARLLTRFEGDQTTDDDAGGGDADSWKVVAGPVLLGWRGSPLAASSTDFSVGPARGDHIPIDAYQVGARTAEEVAVLIAAQTHHVERTQQGTAAQPRTPDSISSEVPDPEQPQRDRRSPAWLGCDQAAADIERRRHGLHALRRQARAYLGLPVPRRSPVSLLNEEIRPANELSAATAMLALDMTAAYAPCDGPVPDYLDADGLLVAGADLIAGLLHLALRVGGRQPEELLDRGHRNFEEEALARHDQPTRTVPECAPCLNLHRATQSGDGVTELNPGSRPN